MATISGRLPFRPKPAPLPTLGPLKKDAIPRKPLARTPSNALPKLRDDALQRSGLLRLPAPIHEDKDEDKDEDKNEDKNEDGTGEIVVGGSSSSSCSRSSSITCCIHSSEGSPERAVSKLSGLEPSFLDRQRSPSSTYGPYSPPLSPPVSPHSPHSPHSPPGDNNLRLSDFSQYSPYKEDNDDALVPGEAKVKAEANDSVHTNDRTSTKTEMGCPLFRAHFDGGADPTHSVTPDLPPKCCMETSAYGAEDNRSYPRKRKASTFSLKSLSHTLSLSSKRPRLGIRKFVSHVCQGGSQRLSVATQHWKKQTQREKRHFENWKAGRRRQRPADPLKGKSEKGFGHFSVQKTRFGHEEWWKDGVESYRAPSWLHFGTTAELKERASGGTT